MAKIKSPDELSKQTSKKESEINKEVYIKATEIINQKLQGLPVSKDTLQTALKICQLQSRFKSSENNERNVDLSRARFGYQLAKDYGLPQNKKDKEKIIKLVAPDVRLLEAIK